MATILPFGGVRPRVAETAWLAPTAVLVGDVEVEADAAVLFGAVLRGDTDRIVLGAGSNLQDGAVAHADRGVPTTIGAGVSIGHGAVVHGCTVGDDCLIGMHATVLNRAVIGRGSLVAGVPGRVRRPLTAEEQERIRANAATYRALAAAYRDLA